MNHDCTKKHLLLFLIIGCFVGRCWILNNTRIFCEEVESPNSLKNRESLRITMGFLISAKTEDWQREHSTKLLFYYSYFCKVLSKQQGCQSYCQEKKRSPEKLSRSSWQRIVFHYQMWQMCLNTVRLTLALTTTTRDRPSSSTRAQLPLHSSTKAV